MALQRGKYRDLPADSIVLTEGEALKYQTNVLNHWKSKSDTFGYKYGIVILGSAGFFSGVFLNSYYRQKFKLRSYGRIATFLPLAFLPSAFSALTHGEFVLNDVIIQKRSTCPVCLEMRAAALQSLVGCVFPAVLAPLANLSLVNKYMTLPIPNIAEEPKKLLNFVRLKSLPVMNVMLVMFLGHAFLGSAVTYLESQSVITVNRKLKLLEDELENN